MKYILILSLLLLNACTYTAHIRQFDVGSTPPATLRDKTVAIVVEKERIQDNHTTNTDVYAFEFKDVTLGVTEALQKRVSMSAKKVDIVKAEDLKPNTYQVLIYPSVQARSVHDFWTMGCYIEYGLEIRNGKDNRVLVNEKGTGKRNFFGASAFDEKCRLAMSEVFNSVTDRSLNLIRL